MNFMSILSYLYLDKMMDNNYDGQGRIQGGSGGVHPLRNDFVPLSLVKNEKVPFDLGMVM
jgi:hypothetical protein